MDTCDVLIAGGGPAGSACAWRLCQSGLNVIVMDRAVFPRDKVCAGWITPPVVAALQIDLEEYGRGRTLQPITAFLTGVIGDAKTVRTPYKRAVSYGIRRCEFDHFLLHRSRARLELGTPVTSLERAGGDWVVNATIRTPLIVGAGGHFCPVARRLNPGESGERPVVVAREVEFRVEADEASAIDPECPELYFKRDLSGYGWCVRKQDHLNVGFGQLRHRALPKATDDFVTFLQQHQRLRANRQWRWFGHAYALNVPPHRRVVDTGVLLVGDAAGLAYARSGEGIRPAVESGLLAAAAIVNAAGRYGREELEPYENRLRGRFPPEAAASRLVPAGLRGAMGRRLIGVPAFARHILLNRWFLHAHAAALAV